MNIKSLIFSYFKYILSPPFCRFCKRFILDYSVLCSLCLSEIKPILSQKIYISNKYSITVYALSDYKNPIKSMILAKSYSDYSMAKELAHLIWNYSIIKNLYFDYLIPIPLHWSRLAFRGYNQSEVMARELALLSNWSFFDCLARSKRTEFQSELSVQERVKNVKDVFRMKKSGSDLKSKHVLLVDDLMTTGATLISAARVLKKYKPASISAIVGARVLSNT